MQTVIDRTAEAVVALLMAAMCLTVFAGVVFRYALLQPLAWTEEVARLCLVWVSFVGAYLAHRRREHIAVTLMVDRLAPAVRRRVRAAAAAVIIAFMLALVVQGLRYALAFLSARTPMLGIPLAVIYAALPASAALLIGAVLVDLWRELRGGPAATGGRS